MDDFSSQIKKAIADNRAAFKQLIESKLDDYYGGPEKWQTDFREGDEDFAIEIWNEAIEKAIEIVRGI